MKTKHLVLYLIIMVISASIFQSCKPQKQDNKQKAYMSGELLSENIIKYYFIASEQLNFTNSYQLELANLLSNEMQTSYNNFGSLENDLDTKVKIFSQYSAVMQEMQINNGISNDNFKLKMFSLLNVIDLSGLSSADTVDMIRQYISAGKYDKNVAVVEISNLVFGIWQQDVLSWHNKLNTLYSEYSAMIDDIPADIFDEEKLEKFVYEPYQGKETLVKIYKLNMKQEVYEANSIFMEQTAFLLRISMSVKAVYTQLTQKFRDEQHINSSNEQNYNTLKSFDLNNEIQNNL